MIQLYTLPNNGTYIAAYDVDRETWSLFPAVSGGYRHRHAWSPSPSTAKLILTAEGYHGQIYRLGIQEISHQARWLGLPDGATKSPFEAHRA